MAGGGSAGGRTRTQARGRPRRQQLPTLPFDVLLDVAVRTDPATLVRCAATCLDMRRRIKDDGGLRGRLRLRHGDRFVLPLLRGHLIRSRRYNSRSQSKEELFLVDTTAPDATRLCKAAGGGVPLVSRDGLVLARVGEGNALRVCDPATRSSHTLPSEPASPAGAEKSYALLVNEDDEDATSVGRHFQVVMLHLDLSLHRRYLLLHIFSSAHGAWSPCTEIRAHNLPGSRLLGLGKALVIGSSVHWLCSTDSGVSVLKLHLRAMQLTVTMLPESFLHRRWHSKLLATSSAGGSPIVLVAEGEKILSWAQSKKTAKWQQRPQVVIEADAILDFLDMAGGRRPSRPVRLSLVWFAARSGTVLINMSYYDFFWLDLQSMEIVRWFSGRDLSFTATANVPYEMNLAAWVPTFSSSL